DLHKEIEKKRHEDASFQPTEEVQERQKALYHVLECIGMELYFASGAFDEKKAGREGVLHASDRGGRETFLVNAEPVVDSLLGVGLAPVSHHLVQFLAAYVDVAPERV